MAVVRATRVIVRPPKATGPIVVSPLCTTDMDPHCRPLGRSGRGNPRRWERTVQARGGSSGLCPTGAMSKSTGGPFENDAPALGADIASADDPVGLTKSSVFH